MQETWVQSLGWADPLEKEMATTPVFLPGKFHGQRSLAGYSPWGCKELDTTLQRNNYHNKYHPYCLVIPLIDVSYKIFYFQFNTLGRKCEILTLYLTVF